MRVYACVCARVCACIWMQLSIEAGRGWQMPEAKEHYMRLWTTPRSSERTGSTLTCWAIFPAWEVFSRVLILLLCVYVGWRGCANTILCTCGGGQRTTQCLLLPSTFTWAPGTALGSSGSDSKCSGLTCARGHRISQQLSSISNCSLRNVP